MDLVTPASGGGWGPAHRPATRPDLAAVDLDGERVVYDPATDGVTRLDRMGSLIWPFLDGTATMGELGDDLAHAFGVEPEVVARDLSALVGQLDQLGLLVGRSPPVGGSLPAPPAPARHLVDPPRP